MRTALALIVGIAVVTQPDAARVLDGVRQALGGDAAIAALQGFSVTGSESHSAGGHSASLDVEFLCALPDRFLHVRRSANPFGITTEESGFNGNQRIRRRDSDMPYPPDPGEHDTPAEKAQRDARTLANARREFTRMATAMIGLSAIDPVDVSAAGQQTIAGNCRRRSTGAGAEPAAGAVVPRDAGSGVAAAGRAPVVLRRVQDGRRLHLAAPAHREDRRSRVFHDQARQVQDQSQARR